MKIKLIRSLVLMLFGAASSAAFAEELKLADFQPSSHPFAFEVYAPLAEQVKVKTDGEVSIRVFMGGELGPGPAEQYNRVVNGVTDIAFGLPGYTASNFPKTLLTELPGVVTPETGTERVLSNLSSLSEEYRRVVLLSLWHNAPNMLMMSKKPVRSFDDLKGLKIRTPSRNAGLILEAWGASPVSMPVTDVYNAMQTGVIDGAYIDATILHSFKLAEVTNYITHGMTPTISSFFLIMNRDSYKSLSPSNQTALMNAGRLASIAGNKVQLSQAERAISDFSSTPGKEVITLSPEEIAKFNAASKVVVEKVIAEADEAGLEASAYVEALQK